jgi:hypothetical protein
MIAYSFITLGKFEGILGLQGEIYWTLKQYEQAKVPYRRLAAAAFFNGKIPRETFLVRSGISLNDLGTYLETFIRPAPGPPESEHLNTLTTNESFSNSGRYCDGCRILNLPPLIRGTFHHCLLCSDSDFCAKCFARLKEGQSFPPCSKVHEFLDVPTRFWSLKGDPLRSVTEEGETVDAWVKQWREKFLEDMRSEQQVTTSALAKKV